MRALKIAITALGIGFAALPVHAADSDTPKIIFQARSVGDVTQAAVKEVKGERISFAPYTSSSARCYVALWDKGWGVIDIDSNYRRGFYHFGFTASNSGNEWVLSELSPSELGPGFERTFGLIRRDPQNPSRGRLTLQTIRFAEGPLGYVVFYDTIESSLEFAPADGSDPSWPW